MHAILSAVAVLSLVSSALCQGSSITLLPVADSTLYEDAAGSFANGAGEGLFVGRIASGQRRRALLAFDVAAAVPSGARVVEVELQMTVTRGFAQGLVATELHRMTSPWVEGPSNATLFREGQGVLSIAGDNTWLHTSYPSSFWSQPGGDFAPVASGVAGVPPLGPVVFASTSALVADVQGWLDAPATNAGWCMRTDELVPQEVRRLDSRQSSVVGAEPRLRIRWVQPGGFAALGAGCGAPAPSLSLAGALQVGGSFAALVQGGPGGVAILLYDGSVVQPPVEVLPSCFAFLGATAVSAGLALLDGTGTGGFGFTVPTSPVFAGLAVGFQAAVFDGAQPLGLGVTNAVLAVIL